MKDQDKTKGQLIDELVKLRKRNAELEGLEIKYKQTEKTLTNERLKLKQCFEKLPILVYNIGLDGKILNCNNLVVKKLGYKSKKELIGKPLITTIYAPSSREKVKTTTSGVFVFDGYLMRQQRV